MKHQVLAPWHALRRPRCRLCLALVAALAVMSVVVLNGLGGASTVRAVTDLGQLLFAATAAATTGHRARVSTGRSRASWAAIAAGCGAWALGEAVWSWYELVLGRATPFPSAADLGFLLFPVGASTGLWLQGQTGSADARRRSLLDGLTLTAALGLVWWATVLGTVARTPADSRLAFAVSLAYPASDLVVIALVVFVLSKARRGRRQLVLVAAGLTALAVADSSFAYLTATGSYTSGNVTDLGWAVGFALLAAAPLGGTWVDDDGREEEDLRGRAAPSKLPYLPVLLAILVVGTQRVTGGRPDAVESALAVVTVVLVLLRQYLVVRENAHLVTTLSEREEQLRHQAFHDALTGLANRALFQDRVAHALDLHRRDLRSLAVLFFDLDDFKLVNDGLGHQAGDTLLVRVAERLRGTLRAGDTLARLGGDEFAILLEDGGDPWAVAGQVIEVMSSPYTVGGRSLAVTASVGLTVVDAAATTPAPDAVLAQADTAMYAAKRAGKGCFRAFEPGMELTEIAEDALRRRLSAAIDSGCVRLAYQPILEVPSGELLGFEALARWQDEGADVPPDVFVPAAERMGLIEALTEHVLDRVCAQVAAWDRAGARTDFTVAVNVSPQRVVDPAFPDQVLAALSRHGVQASRLVLEITESGLLSDLDAAQEVTSRLDAHGLRFSLDDFGTGYSSLTHLSRIPLQSLKIDRVFIRELGRDEDQSRFTDALLRFGANLGLEVIAEGVERPEQLARLEALGCRRAQGFLLGPPAPASSWTAALLGGGRWPHLPRQRERATRAARAVQP